MPKNPNRDPLDQELEELRAEVARLRAAQSAKITLTVSPKGALSVYGLQRFPVTLYANQWETVLDHGNQIREFIAANAGSLARK